MKVIEMIYPIGGYLASPVTAIVECTPQEALSLPGVEWHGVAAYTGGEYRAHLRGSDPATANAIMSLTA